MSDKNDKDLFSKHMLGVRRKSTDNVATFHHRPQAIPKQTRRQEKEIIETLQYSDFEESIVETGDELLFYQPGIQLRILNRLKRGEFAIQAELDLHGYTSEEARGKFNQFLLNSRSGKRTCVRIIHGKGLRSPGGKPVLKQKVAAWLAKRKDVLAFCQAPNHDGGSGALYVLLAKQ